MKLTYFSEQTMPKQMGGGNKLPRIAFGKAGIISFNALACQLIGLKAKDKITLAQDPDHPENWYLFKDPQHGFELRGAYKDQGVQFNHIVMVKAFLEAMDRPADKTHNFKIAGQPTTIEKTKYWGIII